MRKWLLAAALTTLLALFVGFGTAEARSDDTAKSTAAGTTTTGINLDSEIQWITIMPVTEDVVVRVHDGGVVRRRITVRAGVAIPLSVGGMDSLYVVRASSTAFDYTMSYDKNAVPVVAGGGSTEATDSLVALLSTTTDSYGTLVSHGRVEVVINESADDIAYGTPKLYSVPMAGYSKLTIKCVYGGAATTSIPLVTAILSSTSDITLATGNPVWFDTTPLDSTITGWMLPIAPESDIGTAISITDIYGNWATSDYIIIKVTASTDTSADIQDFKLIAIKEQ